MEQDIFDWQPPDVEPTLRAAAISLRIAKHVYALQLLKTELELIRDTHGLRTSIPDVEGEERILALIRARGFMTKADITRNTHWCQRMVRDRLLASLEQRGLIKGRELNVGVPGRPSMAYTYIEQDQTHAS